MQYRNRYHLTRVIQVVAFLFVLVGLGKIADGEYASGAVILFGSVMIGLITSVLMHYYKTRQNDSTFSQKAALEALAKLGAPKKKE